MKLRKMALGGVVLAGLVLAGCSTIAFFPTAPAQKAADKVIDDIWPTAPERAATAAEVRK